MCFFPLEFPLCATFPYKKYRHSCFSDAFSKSHRKPNSPLLLLALSVLQLSLYYHLHLISYIPMPYTDTDTHTVLLFLLFLKNFPNYFLSFSVEQCMVSHPRTLSGQMPSFAYRHILYILYPCRASSMRKGRVCQMVDKFAYAIRECYFYFAKYLHYL